MKRKKLSKSLRAQVLARDKSTCLMCGRRPPEVKLHVDHVVPVAGDGTDVITNLATLCADCNLGKSDYNFGDYTNIEIVPSDIKCHFKYRKVQSAYDDYFQCQLYCYFKNGIHGGGPDDSFPPHGWKLTGLDLFTSSDPDALEKRRREEESEIYVQKIRMKLIEERSKLVINEEGLCKVPSSG